MTVAWCYLVVSSDKQSDTLEHQRAWAQETARQKGWTLERYFEGVKTGKHGPRSILRDLHAELLTTDSVPEWVLMLRLDRVGRGTIAESQFLLHQINALGVRIWTRDGGEEKNDSAADELIRSAKLFTARHENDVRREKSLNAHKRKRLAGQHAGHTPYGVALVSGYPVAHEPEASFVQEMFSRRLEGWGTHRLARYAASFAPEKHTANGKTRKMLWGASTVARMLSCKTYRGLVIDEDTWDAVQGIQFPTIDRTAKYAWPLRGAVRCTCGHLVSTTYSGPQNHRTRYYTCRNVAVHQRYPYHRADLLETQFLELLRSLSIDPSAMYSEGEVDITPLRDRLKALNAELADIDTRRKRVWELAEQVQIPAEEVSRRINELTERKNELESSISSVKREIAAGLAQTATRRSISDVVQTSLEAWDYADVEMQREVVKAVANLIGGLWVDPDKKNTLVTKTV